MLLRLLTTIAGLALIAAALLGLRQQRLQTLHAMSDLHVHMDRDRKATWDAQAQIAELTHPQALRDAVGRVALEVQPMPTADALSPPAAHAWPDPETFEHAPTHTPTFGEPLAETSAASGSRP